MFIKNLKNEDFTLLGVNLEPNEIIPLKDLGTRNQILLGIDEILTNISSGNVHLEYTDGYVETSTAKIASILQGNSSEVVVSNLSEIDIGEVKMSASDIRGNDFYYNTFYKDMSRGESIDLEFKGYLKSVSLIIEEGEIEVQIIKPKMNKVRIKDFNTYDIDTDFKIKDAVIRIHAIKRSQVTLYVDGLYFDETGTKSKDQYLEEIYGEDLPAPIIPDDKVKMFEVDLLNYDLTSDSIVDEVGHSVGLIKGSIVNNIFTKDSVINFKNIFNVTEYDSWTHGFWFKANDLSSSRYIAYKSGLFYIYQSRSTLYVNYDNKMIKVADLVVDKWFNLIATYSKEAEVLNFYINGTFVATYGSKPSFSNRTSDFLIGNLSYSSNRYGFEGQFGKISNFNYHMSAGMVKHLFDKQNPLEQIDTNLVSKINMRYFDVTNRGYNPPDNKQEFDLIEKEYARTSNLIHQEYLPKISFMDSTMTDVTTRNYYLSIGTGLFLATEEGYYKFRVQGDDIVEITIDDRLVVANYDGSTEPVDDEIYLKEGYHDFKFRHYQLNGESTFYAYSWNYSISDWDKVVLYQKDTEDEVAAVEDKSKIIDISDWVSNVEIITDDNAYEQKEENTIKYFEFNDYNACKLTLPVSPKIYDLDKFSISFAYYVEETKEHFIFGQGKTSNWGDRILLRNIGKGKLELTVCDKAKKTSNIISKDKWYKIDIVSDGITVKMYVDADEKISFEYKDNDWFNGDEFWFNRLSSGTSWGWSKSKFRINDFIFYNTAKEKEIIQANYKQFENKYK